MNLKGKRHLLAKGKANRASAYREYLRITDQHNPEVATAGSVEAICPLFMPYARANLKPNTVNGHTQYAIAFCESVRDMDANSVQPKHVSDFLNAHPNWNSTSRHSAIRSIKRVWAWALAEGHVTLNQLKAMKRPLPQQRDTIPDDKAMARFIAAANPAFRQLLTFMREIGCRPREASLIQKHHVDLENREIRFKIGEDETSGKAGKPRVIHRNDTALPMIRGLIAIFPAHCSGTRAANPGINTR